MRYQRMSDYAVYLGDGVWWQITERDHASGRYDRLPVKYRKWQSP